MTASGVLPSRAAGLPKDFRIHELRHTAASLLIAEGAGPQSVQARLGHSTIVTTSDVYGHLFSNRPDVAMDGFDRRRRQAVPDQQQRNQA